MKKQIISRYFIFLFSFILLCAELRVQATDVNESRPLITGRRTCDDAVYVYIDGVTDPQDITVQLGTEPCSDVEWSQGAFPRRTLLLLDNSLSISQHWKKQSLSLMESLIGNHAPGEEFMVATFSTGINKLSSYSDDYESLKAAVAGITFENQKSYLTDVLYELLTETLEDKEKTFYRFVIIADGADDNEITYTQQELQDLIKKAGVPLYSIGVNTGGNASQLQTMFAWSRLSSIEPIVVDKKTDAASVEPGLHTDPLCVRIVPERSMQDGGTREARISIDGVNLTTTLQMPFASEAEEPAEEEEEASPTPEKASPTPEEKKEPVKEREEVKEEKSDSSLPIILMACGALVLVLVIVLIIVAIKRKGKDDEPRYLEDTESGGKAGAAPEDNAPTEMVEPVASGKPGTRELWNHFIMLTDSSDPSRSFRVPIIDRIVIGRKEPADLILDFDKAVSARHCMISRIDGRYYLRDLGSSNHSYYEGMVVTSDVLLQNGGHIRIGHGDYIFESG